MCAGIVPGIVGTTHGGFQFVAYEDLKKRFNRRANRHAEAQLATWEYIVCATTSKIFAGTVTYPYQVNPRALRGGGNEGVRGGG